MARCLRIELFAFRTIHSVFWKVYCKTFGTFRLLSFVGQNIGFRKGERSVNKKVGIEMDKAVARTLKSAKYLKRTLKP